jgi:DNA-binding beta-propeller fold protein YncE
VDDRRFDELSRRVGALALPRLPRRGLIGLLGGATLTGALGGALLEPQPAAAAKCKDEGKKCDKKQCKKKDKKCCCKDLKCKNGRCKAKGSTCPTGTDFDFDVETFNGSDRFNNPFGIATDPDGNVFVTDTDNFRVVAFNKNGVFQDEFGDSGQGDDEFEEPLGIGFNERSNGNLRLYVVDPIQNSNDRRIRNFQGDIGAGDFGDQKNTLGDDTGDSNSHPAGVTVDQNNRIWITNAESTGTIFLFNRDGDFLANFEPSFSSPCDDELQNPAGIAVFKDDKGNEFVYVADTGNHRIVKFRHVSNNSDTGLEYVTEVGRINNGNCVSGSGNNDFNQPTGLATDECGNVWVADRFNHRIAIFDKNLDFIDDFSEDFNEPTGVALGPDGNVLYVVDSADDQIVKFTLS